MTENASERRFGGPQPKTRADDARGAPATGSREGTEWEGHRGNLPHVPTEELRLQVRSYAKLYPPTAERLMARKLGMSVSTLRRHYAEDIETGRAELLATIAGQEIALALDAKTTNAKGDQKARQFLMSKMGWTGKLEISGPDGGAVETVDLSRLTPEQLETYGRLAAIAAGVDPDSIIAVPRD